MGDDDKKVDKRTLTEKIIDKIVEIGDGEHGRPSGRRSSWYPKDSEVGRGIDEMRREARERAIREREERDKDRGR